MKKNYFLFSIAMLFLFGYAAEAQKPKKEKVSYKYLKKPLQKLDESIKTYNVVSEVVWEKEEKAKLALYEAEIVRANEDYDAEMETYNNKKTGNKIVERALLGKENGGKPIKRHVPRPYIRPILDKSYISSQVNLNGFERGTSNDLTIKIILQNAEIGAPREIASRSEPIKYHFEATIRQPISYEVIDASGNVIYTEVVNNTNAPKIVKSKEYTAGSAWDSYKRGSGWTTYLESQTTDQINRNMRQVNISLNNQFGFSEITRLAIVYNAESKKFDYKAQLTAAIKAKRAYENYLVDKENASEKFNECIEIWKKELEESNPDNKKARINGAVTQALYCNIAEAYITIGEYSKAADYLDELDLMVNGGKKKFEKRAELIRHFYKDEKKRNT